MLDLLVLSPDRLLGEALVRVARSRSITATRVNSLDQAPRTPTMGLVADVGEACARNGFLEGFLRLRPLLLGPGPLFEGPIAAISTDPKPLGATDVQIPLAEGFRFMTIPLDLGELLTFCTMEIRSPRRACTRGLLRSMLPATDLQAIAEGDTHAINQHRALVHALQLALELDLPDAFCRSGGPLMRGHCFGNDAMLAGEMLASLAGKAEASGLGGALANQLAQLTEIQSRQLELAQLADKLTRNQKVPEQTWPEVKLALQTMLKELHTAPRGAYNRDFDRWLSLWIESATCVVGEQKDQH